MFSEKIKKNKNQKGQSMVEYVALTALVAIVCIGTVKVFGGRVRSRMHQITNTFDRNVQQGLKAHHSGWDDSGDSDDEDGDGQSFPFPKRISLPRLPKGLKLPFPH